MHCSTCEILRGLHDMDRRISRLYHNHNIWTPGDITLHIFNDFVPIQVIHRPGPTYTKLHKGTWIVWTDGDDPLAERRVNMAHELGHILLHAGNQLFDSAVSHVGEEEQANRFAMYALAPTCMLLPYMSELMDSPQKHCAELAEMFCVPYQFMHKRLERLRNDAWFVSEGKRSRVGEPVYE